MVYVVQKLNTIIENNKAKTVSAEKLYKQRPQT
jgi:hypothetical protein